MAVFGRPYMRANGMLRNTSLDSIGELGRMFLVACFIKRNAEALKINIGRYRRNMLLGFIVMALPPIAAISALVYIPYLLYVNRRYGKQTLLHHFVKYALIGYGLSLLYLTLLWYPEITFHPEYYFLNLHPFVWLSECYAMGPEKMAEQLLLNIGMFIPYGLLLPMAVAKTRKLWKVSVIVLLSTLMIETLQYFTGRSADIDDVIMNFTGGVLGYFVFMLLNRLVGQKRWWETMIGRKTTENGGALNEGRVSGQGRNDH